MKFETMLKLGALGALAVGVVVVVKKLQAVGSLGLANIQYALVPKQPDAPIPSLEDLIVGTNLTPFWNTFRTYYM